MGMNPVGLKGPGGPAWMRVTLQGLPDKRLEAMEPCDDDESELAESCAEVPDGARKPPLAARLPFDASDGRELKIHRLSGIVHRVREGDTLVCGRLITERYRAYSADDEEDPEVCQQCAGVSREASDSEAWQEKTCTLRCLVLK